MKRIVFVAALLALTGCGVQRQSVRLTVPSPQVNQPSGKPIVLTSVTDSRQAPEGSKLSGAELARNVGGVWRGAGGIAVDLDSGTAADEATKIVTQSLRGMGYKVVADSDAQANTPHISVDIIKLDVTMPFNFFRAMSYSQKMIADIETSVTVKNGTATQSFRAVGHGENIYQRIIPENWEAALNRAVADYVKQFQDAMLSADKE